ncbi:MAG: chorismate mutase [Chloroflexia bacterium]|nr:chorismate mutase [Chloroflexia bacterium]
MVIQCQSLDEVREQIDRIDRQLVALLAERSGYVLQAAAFKRTAADVAAPRRVEQVVARVRHLAMAEGVDADLVEQVYRTMIARFIDIEQAEYAGR